MSLFNVYPRFDITLAKGEGVYVYDTNNQQYLDLYGGHGVISIGHGHPNYVKQVTSQLKNIGFYSNAVNIPAQEVLATKLAEVSGYLDHQLFLCNSGAEANENAIKLASFHTGKKKVIAFKGSFHGRTAATLNVTDNPKLSAPINLNNFPVEFIELNNQEQLKKSLQANDVCAVIIEGIQGVGGLDAPTDDYLRILSQSCKQHNVVLILDEIQSGYGRTGKFFAHQHANIEADIITMAKGMGNGFPVAGLMIHRDIKPEYGMLGTTFGGNQLACAAAIAVIDTIKAEQLIDHALQVSKWLQEEIKSISAIKAVKGRGLMLGIEFDFPIKELRTELLNDYQILTGSSANPNLLRILPPLTITIDEIEPFSTALKDILA